MKYEWCEKENIHLGLLDDKKGKYFRCKRCKKRFEIFVRSCGDFECYHIYLPKHKKSVKIK